MIPKQYTDNLMSDITFEPEPSKTFKMNNEKENIVNTCDGLDAMRQAIYLILNIERYTCPIVSWNYGVELADLFGQPTTFCIPEIERRIREALLMDDRIKKVYDFTFEIPKKGVVFTKFKVDTSYGTVNGEKVVSI
jgi:hypothetical protein